ncbi:MAG: HU family DNA-binding protein [Spirochaetales bacterium]|nr:HU family DNA-binding protein [Spirochaetales bacterium]
MANSKGKTKKKVKKASKAKASAKSTKQSAPKKAQLPDVYSVSKMVNYLSDKHAVTKKEAKEFFESVFDLIGSGVLSGQRVPMGKLGKMYVRLRPARKARKGRNPITGEEMTIPAKKATKVPKFTFSKSFKEAALKAKM